MYFSSDSWGKFTGDVRFGDRRLGKQAKLEDLIADHSFNPAMKIKKEMYVETLTKLREALRMPIYNPKTGEHDHVDLTLVNKILVDPKFLEDITTNKAYKVSFSFESNQEEQLVVLLAKNEDANMQMAHRIPLQQFEEILFKAIHEAKDNRLENMPEFAEISSSMLEQFIIASRQNQKHYAIVGKEYILTNGIGIIRDTKTDQEIGTFESFEYLVESNKRVVNIEEILLFGRNLDDLQEKHRFEFSFYCLDTNTVYCASVGDSAEPIVTEGDSSLDIWKYTLFTEEFTNQHQYYEMVQEAQIKKSLMDNMSADHPLYDTNLNKFRESRYAILHDSKEKQKKQKLVSQFSDIDL